jgi:hypothetical protein
MTVDGRRTDFSEGVTLVELAAYMANYGATNAINLDGGGSTTMAANYYNDLGGATLVNVPSGSERSVGTNLGLFALPNGDYNRNGTLDSGDYAVWRKSIGGTLGYTAWRSRYGSAATASGSSSEIIEGPSVPEPDVAVLIVILAAGASASLRKKKACATPTPRKPIDL